MRVSQFRLGKRHKEDGTPYLSHRTRRYDSSNAQASYDNGYTSGKPVEVIKLCMCCPAEIYRGVKHSMPRRVVCQVCGVAQDTSYIKTCRETVGNNRTGHKLPASGGSR